MTAGTTDPNSSMRFPVMIIQRNVTTPFSDLQGTDGWLVHMESSRAAASDAAGRSSGLFMLQPEQVICALAAFSEKVHAWYPAFLDTRFAESFYQSINGFPKSRAHTCLAMLVVAIGVDTRDAALNSRA